jgi:DNA-binding winged helix-turn-helix (wHTH) protein
MSNGRSKNVRVALTDFVKSSGDAVVSMDQLFDVAWPNGVVRPNNPAVNIKVQMHHIRKELAGEVNIMAVRNIGYQLTNVSNPSMD